VSVLHHHAQLFGASQQHLNQRAADEDLFSRSWIPDLKGMDDLLFGHRHGVHIEFP
jgi:hypothetical protein